MSPPTTPTQEGASHEKKAPQNTETSESKEKVVADQTKASQERESSETNEAKACKEKVPEKKSTDGKEGQAVVADGKKDENQSSENNGEAQKQPSESNGKTLVVEDEKKASDDEKKASPPTNANSPERSERANDEKKASPPNNERPPERNERAISSGSLPENPPTDRLGRMLSIGRIFSTNDSIAGLLASTDSATKLEGLFRSGVSAVELPPLPTQSEGSKAEKPALPPASSQKPALSSVSSQNDPFVADLTRSQDSMIQKIVQSVSRAADSAFAAAAAPPTESEPAPTPPKKAAPTKTTPPSGLFTSREWGSNLGSFQEVDVQRVFQTSQESLGDQQQQPKDKKKTTPNNRRPKKKRDWNALVMQEFEKSIANPAPTPAPSRATPADAALLVAAAAAIGKQEREEKNEAKPAPKKPPKKRPAPAPRPTAAAVMEAQPPREPVEAEDGSGKKYVEATELDVLLGRGGRSNNHLGNKRYLEAKEAMQARYMAADKNAKTPISQELVDAVKAWGGRFLKLDSKANRWYEVDNSTARKKASQTLREVNTAEERAAKRARYAKS